MRLFVLCLLMTLLAAPLAAAELSVFAAASLTDALREIGASYERETGEKVVFNFGASSTLARQINEGAPADLFLSADEAKMDLVSVDERASVLSNTLVIVGDGIRSPRDLLGKRIALAEPSSVPAGIYAKEYLTSLGLWTAIAPNVVPAENVRAALAAVDSGNVDAAIVYKTDARNRFALEVPREQGPRISYPFAILKNAEHPDGARRFLTYLRSKPALDVFRKHGFLVQ
jgi:molybdate transport system substrate-binding protein